MPGWQAPAGPAREENMQVYGSASIADLLGQCIAYRSLCPVDPRLQHVIAGQSARTCRKGDLAYARIVTRLLEEARRLDQPAAQLERLIVVGDTRVSDGGAFTSLCQYTGWTGRA